MGTAVLQGDQYIFFICNISNYKRIVLLLLDVHGLDVGCPITMCPPSCLQAGLNLRKF